MCIRRLLHGTHTSPRTQPCAWQWSKTRCLASASMSYARQMLISHGPTRGYLAPTLRVYRTSPCRSMKERVPAGRGKSGWDITGRA